MLDANQNGYKYKMIAPTRKTLSIELDTESSEQTAAKKEKENPGTGLIH